ncbi:sugar kinase [Ktedonobacter sp. SOSP1-85]|uniref:ROK family protein n=1 Tax=Ktedonobacter sp. SOSP1-85 TaxID=2778367 RepID=UPI0019156205|nr:ROK family protein [Ktedonobacter sp. SOSP1-85]GHO79881.1 sugar kinase [Ktedonobacter sp. SOSP1-85]
MKRTHNPVVPDVRQISRSTILRQIYLGKSMSRQKLSQYSGLSSATITNVVVELLQEGIVIESGIEASQGGRPRSILTINPQYGYFIGVDIGETLIRVELFDLTLHKLSSIAYPQVLDENRPEQAVQFICQGAEAVLAEVGITLEKVLGIGIGVGGLVERGEQIAAYVPSWGWQSVPLVSLLEKYFSMPIYLDNGAKAMAQAESLFGAGQWSEHLAVLLVGTGIGAGIIADDSLYRGGSNNAGEWGHTTIELNGRLCRCGGYGCLEAYAGAPGIIERLREVAPQSSLLQSNDQERIIAAIVAAARNGDRAAIGVLEDTAHYLGAGIANLINLFNPQVIVLGGWVGLEIGEYILPELHRFAERYALKRLFSATRIELSRLGQDAVAMGAAAFTLEQFLEVAGRHTSSSLK